MKIPHGVPSTQLEYDFCLDMIRILNVLIEIDNASSIPVTFQTENEVIKIRTYFLLKFAFK